MVFALLGLVNTQWASAQDVTIRANNGACVAAVKNNGSTDNFFNLGGFATWQHEQLNMVLTASDGINLTPNGQLDNPANNLFKSSDGVHMMIGHGAHPGSGSSYGDYTSTGDNAPANRCFLTVSLPSGYRFTGYVIEFTKPSGIGNDFNGNGQQSTFSETNSNFATNYTSATITTGGAQKKIEREESAANPMGNVLYFMLRDPSESRAMIQLENAKFYFTAEDDFSPVTPASEISTPVSATLVPYPTSKVDFGTIENNNYNGTWRISYKSANVNDISANFLLYEAESITDGTDVDGMSGKVVDFKTGSQYTITSAGGYFKLGKGASSTEEQVYFIETPTSVEISDGHKVPIGYRITGIEYDYATNVTASRTFRIRYQDDGTWYYLNSEGRFTTTQVQWEMDGEGYISTGSGNNKRYLYFNNGYAATQRTKPDPSERFGIDSSNNIYQLQWPTYFITYYRERTGGIFIPQYTRYGMISNTTGDKATYQQINTSTASVGNFKLKIYNADGSEKETVDVTGNGTYPLTGLNNDAVKFGVIGQGLVRATLTMQALDPYLDQMSVWCSDLTQPEIKLEQTFHASDFSVSGGEFDFYLPDDCINDQIQITFENLTSQYVDETYDDYNAATGPHYSRINFVRSAHYDAFGTTNNVIYTNPSEAANAQLERLKVGIVGSAPFKFNNADQVGTSGGTIEEYAFSLANYKNAPNSGTFGDMKFTVKATTQTDTRYVFTTDETRYNIAPTTATQHRAYAFYQMKVNIHSTTYNPLVKFKKIYNQTLYGTGQTDAFYGAEISTDAPASVGAGYVSTDEVYAKIENLIKTGKDDFNNEAPKSAKQILYIDFSNLQGVYQRTTDSHQSMSDFSATGAANCLIFVPSGAGATVPNVAEKVGKDSYRATYNFVLTDKEPFYSPYDIQVPSARTMTYKRLVTKDKYGKVQNASIILPFAIALDESGKHTNADGTSFTLHTMQSSSALVTKDNKVMAFFPAMTDVTTAAANKPYLVNLEGNSSEDNVTFTITQPGALVSKTTDMAGDYTFSGDASTGVTVGAGGAEGTWKFTPKGTFAGQKVARDANIFYFAKNVFVSSADLGESYGEVKIAPFRAYYTTSSNGAKLSSFTPVFEEGLGDVPTAIEAVDASQFIDMDAPVYDLQGRMVARTYRDLTEKKVQRGLYVINGVKIMIK